MRRKFSLHPRKTPSGKKVYYVQFKLSSGKWSTAKSSGESSRVRAEEWAEEELQRKGIYTSNNITFAEFSKDFFNWEGQWALNKRVRGLRISESHCMDVTTKLNTHLLPVFGNMKFYDIDKLKIQQFRNRLFQKGLSGSFINKCLYVLKAILEAAEDNGFIQAVPKIERAAIKSKARGVLTMAEVKQLFSAKWYNNMGYVGNLLACVTGLRLGELQGLLLSDLYLDEGYITIKRSWNRKINKLNETTKTGKERNLLVPSYVIQKLKTLAEKNPFKKPDSFLFYSVIEGQPIDAKVFVKSFLYALEQIGIDNTERKRRNISFHSHRHWFNSLLLNAKIPLHKVQSLTGHLTQEMTGHYYHLDDMQDVKQIQEELFN